LAFTDVLFGSKVLTLPTSSVNCTHKRIFSTLTSRKTDKDNEIVVVVVVHTMTACGKVQLQLHRFLPSPLPRGDWSASHLGFFTLRD